MNLQPQAYFTVVRQIANHTDSATYYVRAVVRNAFTDETIATLDLTDKGSQRFKKDWMVPADTSGQGFYISIVTSVYTDSGYTTKSENYGDEENTYLVQERVMRLGGGGGISAADVRRVVQEELANLPKPEKVTIPEYTPTNLAPVLTAISGVKDAVASITIPTPEKPEKVNLAPVLSALDAVKAAIEAKDVTPETDLSPLLERLDQIDQARTTDHQEAISTIMDTLPAKVEEIMGSIELSVAPTKATPQKKAAEPEPLPFDIKQLAL